MIVSLFLAAAAGAAAPASGSLAKLTGEEGKSQCLPDRSLCLEVPPTGEDSEAGAVLRVSSPGAEAVSLTLPEFAEAQSVELWSRLIRAKDDPDRYLVGILTGQTSMYSGGGGSASQLHLIELDAAPKAPRLGDEVLAVPWTGSLLIRACFSESDMKDRFEACHDEYDFGATLAPAPGSATVFPTLSYRAVATAFPRTSRRSEDNSGTKLKRADLVRAQDSACTYDRVLRYDVAASRYQLDRPLPDCSDYTTP
jgi:hypothetical protein